MQHKPDVPFKPTTTEGKSQEVFGVGDISGFIETQKALRATMKEIHAGLELARLEREEMQSMVQRVLRQKIEIGNRLIGLNRLSFR